MIFQSINITDSNIRFQIAHAINYLFNQYVALFASMPAGIANLKETKLSVNDCALLNFHYRLQMIPFAHMPRTIIFPDTFTFVLVSLNKTKFWTKIKLYQSSQ
jgi:hypothetical protein